MLLSSKAFWTYHQSWLVTPGNADGAQLMMPLLAKALFEGIRQKRREMVQK
jgi:hypothetical protein